MGRHHPRVRTFAAWPRPAASIRSRRHVRTRRAHGARTARQVGIGPPSGGPIRRLAREHIAWRHGREHRNTAVGAPHHHGCATEHGAAGGRGVDSRHHTRDTARCHVRDTARIDHRLCRSWYRARRSSNTRLLAGVTLHPVLCRLPAMGAGRHKSTRYRQPLDAGATLHTARPGLSVRSMGNVFAAHPFVDA